MEERKREGVCEGGRVEERKRGRERVCVRRMSHLFVDVIVLLEVSRSSRYHVYMDVLHCLPSINTILERGG